MTDSVSETSFAYVAQNAAGSPVSGTIESPSIESAAKQLDEFQLRVTRLTATTPARKSRISGSEFAALNQQLAYLTRSNVPVEKGLRLLAEEMDSPRAAAMLLTLAADLEAGMLLDEAIDRQRDQFPPVYATVIRAGLASGSLADALLNFNRHVELVSRLRQALWRAIAYPMLLVAMLLVTLTFVGHYIVPQYRQMISWHWGRPPSAIPMFIFSVAQVMPWILLGLLILAILVAIACILVRFSRLRGSGGDFLLWLPMIGGVLRHNLLARWCDALQLTTAGGIPLSQGVSMAAEMVGSPTLQRDSEVLANSLAAGEVLDQTAARMRLLPPTLLNTAQLAAEHGELSRALGVLATMYQQVAEMRLNRLQNTLVPLLLLSVAAVIFFVTLGLFEPMISII